MARTVSQCEYCGDDLGRPVEKVDQLDFITCGKRECERWARDEYQAVVDEEHRRIDDYYYGR